MNKNKINAQLYQYEQDSWNENLLICGIDEVGRGCLAGPVVTAAVILKTNTFHPLIKDSKLLKPTELQQVYTWLTDKVFFTIGINSSYIIDQHNIHRATAITMKQALLNLLTISPTTPKAILIDAMPLALDDSPYKKIPCISLIKGESRSASIAAASIIAKVTRDSIMKQLHKSFPAYSLHNHKGYATKSHRLYINHFQPSIIHRKTFLKNFSQKDLNEQQSIFC